MRSRQACGRSGHDRRRLSDAPEPSISRAHPASWGGADGSLGRGRGEQVEGREVSAAVAEFASRDELPVVVLRPARRR
jgi:hypothetical protein